MPRFELIAVGAVLGVVVGAWVRRSHPGRYKVVVIGVAFLLILGLVLYALRTP